MASGVRGAGRANGFYRRFVHVGHFRVRDRACDGFHRVPLVGAGQRGDPAADSAGRTGRDRGLYVHCYAGRRAYRLKRPAADPADVQPGHPFWHGGRGPQNHGLHPGRGSAGRRLLRLRLRPGIWLGERAVAVRIHVGVRLFATRGSTFSGTKAWPPTWGIR